jgi:hypothetical protein
MRPQDSETPSWGRPGQRGTLEVQRLREVRGGMRALRSELVLDEQVSGFSKANGAPRALHTVADACASGGQAPFVNSRGLMIGASEFRSKAQNHPCPRRSLHSDHVFRSGLSEWK